MVHSSYTDGRIDSQSFNAAENSYLSYNRSLLDPRCLAQSLPWLTLNKWQIGSLFPTGPRVTPGKVSSFGLTFSHGGGQHGIDVGAQTREDC